MSLHAAYTRYLIAKIDAGDSIEGIRLEVDPFRTDSLCYRLHLGTDAKRPPLYLGNDAQATMRLNLVTLAVREVTTRLNARQSRIERFLSRI